MEKKFRKEIESQLALSIAYILKKSDEKAAAGMAKIIKAASKTIAKKFVKHKLALAEQLNEKKEEAAKQTLEKKGKESSKKAVRKTLPAKKAVKKTTRK